MDNKKSRRRSAGFTIIELVVVMAIIGLLVSLLMPAVQSARESARKSRCQARLKQLALGLHNYHEQHSVLPPGSLKIGSAYRPFSGWGWAAMALPQIDQSALYHQVDFESNNLVGSNLAVSEKVLPFFLCPSDSSPQTIQVQSEAGETARVAAGNFLGVESVLKEIKSTRFSQITDGLSNTFMLSESRYHVDNIFGDESTSSWIGIATFKDEWVTNSVPHFPVATFSKINRALFSSSHYAGCNFAIADGHVRYFSENMDESVFLAMGTKQGGEVVSF